MAVAGVDQVAALASALFGAVSLTFPASRPVDALTRSHARAAARLHGAACWLLRGPDLASVVRRTPYTTESAQELWAYYEGLPLTARPDVFIGFWCALELLRASGTFSRKEHPLLGRVIDAYTAALGAACFVPRRFFFHLHRLLWSSEYRAAVREAGEPAPLLLSREALAYLERLVGSASRGAAPPGGQGGASALARAVPALVAASLGAGGAAVLAWGVEGTRQRLRRARGAVAERWARARPGGARDLPLAPLQGSPGRPPA